MTKQDGGSVHDLLTGSGVIYRKYIIGPLTLIVNFRHFHSVFPPYFQLHAPHFYFKMILPRFRVSIGPGGSILM